MTLFVASNMTAMTASGHLNRTSKAMAANLAHISSGRRITSASDDAAGLGVATNLETENGSIYQSMRNTNDAISMLQTADAAAEEIGDILYRYHEIFVAGASETLDQDERDYLKDEYTHLREEVDRIVDNLEFNGISLNNITVEAQVGAFDDSDYRIELEIGDMSADSGLLMAGIHKLDSAAAAQGVLSGAVKSVDDATENLNDIRSAIGAGLNRLESALNHNQTYSLALEQARSSIEDADMAAETSQMAKLQIMQQAGVASLAQAKNINQSVLGLLS